jgi:hypothetical protein
MKLDHVLDAVVRRSNKLRRLIQSQVLRWMAVLLIATGCDQLFGLTEIRTDSTTAGDVKRLDAAPSCVAPYIASGDADGDGIPNSMDKCPLVFNEVPEADTDVDGVGDSCDPTMGKDCLLLFEDFRSPTLPCWEQRGNWTHDCASSPGWCSPATFGDAALVSAEPFVVSFATVTGTIETLSNDTVRRVELFVNFDSTAGVSGNSCDVVDAGGNFGIGQATWNAGAIGPMATTTVLPPTPFGAGGVVLRRAQSQCNAFITPNSGGMLQATMVGDPGGVGHVAIRALGVRFNVTALAAYGTGAQCP